MTENTVAEIKFGYIYIITNNVNEKVYVGQTSKTIESRWSKHKKDAQYNKAYIEGTLDAPRNKRGICSALYRAINKHGVENFKITEITRAPLDDLDALEIFWISEKNSLSPNGYNLKTGGDRSSHCEETKKLIAQHSVINNARIIDKLRKNDEVKGLPVHCIYIKNTRGGAVAINKHPLCSRKTFTAKKYGDLDAAKEAMLKFLAELEKIGIPVETPSFKQKQFIEQHILKTSESTA